MECEGFNTQIVSVWQNRPKNRCNSLIKDRKALPIKHRINIECVLLRTLRTSAYRVRSTHLEATEGQSLKGEGGRNPSHPTKTNRPPSLLYAHAKLENLGHYERTQETTR